MFPKILPSFEDKFTPWSWNGKKFRETVFLTGGLSQHACSFVRLKRKFAMQSQGWLHEKADLCFAHPAERTKTAGQFCHFSCCSHSARWLFAGSSERFSASCNCSKVKSGKCPSLVRYVTLLPHRLLLHIWMFCILSWRCREIIMICTLEPWTNRCTPYVVASLQIAYDG